MGWERAIITDSGGFQVFSLAHGGVADEIKGRRGRRSGGAKVEISERGVSFQSLLDGSDRFLGPEESMGIQAKLGSDIALAFDECTPFHADRDYTARSIERTHRWLERCLDWHERERPGRQAVFGIVQGGVHEDLRRESAEAVSAAGVDGVAIGGTLGQEKEEMRGVLGFTVPRCCRRRRRVHLLGIGEVDDLLAGIGLGHRRLRLRGADPPRPPRRRAGAGAGRALPDRPRQGAATRTTTTRSPRAAPARPAAATAAPTCTTWRAAKELTGARLLTLHNLTYMERLTERGATRRSKQAATPPTRRRSWVARPPGTAGS